MIDDEAISFLASSIPSVWALELLLLLKRVAPSGRTPNELVGDLRSSTTAVLQALNCLHAAGITVEEEGACFFRPASPKVDELVAQIEKLYKVKPAVVIRAIIAANNEKLHIFANSFRLRE